MGPAEELKVLAIALAALAAVAMSFGAQFQNDAVSERHKSKERGRGSLNLKQVASLLIRPRWLSGLGMMTLGIVLQLAALSLAPLIVVQPIGAIALIITPLLQKIFPELPGFSLLSAGLVMGIMIVPYIASLSEDAMRAVPMSMREGSYAMGATKLHTAIHVVVPAAVSGLAASYILGISRAVGETMILAVAAGMQPTRAR